VPQKLSTPAYPTPNRLPQSDYSAFCMAIAKTVPPRPISDFLPNIILTSCPGHSVPQRRLPPQTDSPNLNIVSWMVIAKTVPPWPISDFRLNIILPPCPGHSVPQRLSIAAYPTQNRLPQFEYSASWIAITKSVPPRPIFDFLPNIILGPATVPI
jgi:hypothetical protein